MTTKSPPAKRNAKDNSSLPKTPKRKKDDGLASTRKEHPAMKGTMLTVEGTYFGIELYSISNYLKPGCDSFNKMVVDVIEDPEGNDPNVVAILDQEGFRFVMPRRQSIDTNETLLDTSESTLKDGTKKFMPRVYIVRCIGDESTPETRKHGFKTLKEIIDAYNTEKWSKAQLVHFNDVTPPVFRSFDNFFLDDDIIGVIMRHLFDEAELNDKFYSSYTDTARLIFGTNTPPKSACLTLGYPKKLD